jgi:hypothetical protein
MMGVPFEGPTYNFGDNMSVIKNTSTPARVGIEEDIEFDMLPRSVCESVAMGETITAHGPSVSNPADIATKVLPGGQARDNLVSSFLHDFTTTPSATAA